MTLITEKDDSSVRVALRYVDFLFCDIDANYFGFKCTHHQRCKPGLRQTANSNINNFHCSENNTVLKII